MNNEELLQALQSVVKPLEDRMSQIQQSVDAMQADFQGRQDATQAEVKSIHKSLKTLSKTVKSIKEDTEITRAAVNQMGDWVDDASHAIKVPYMGQISALEEKWDEAPDIEDGGPSPKKSGKKKIG